MVSSSRWRRKWNRLGKVAERFASTSVGDDTPRAWSAQYPMSPWYGTTRGGVSTS